MRRTIPPRLEVLEAKALLSASPLPSGLVSSLTAVVGRVGAGDQVAETLTLTNVSGHDLSYEDGPTDDGFTVKQGGKIISDPYLGLLPDFLTVDTLKPGQSAAIHATWDGRANGGDPAQPWEEGPPLSGTFTISDSLDGRKATATVVLPKFSTVPVKLTHLVPPLPPAPRRA